MNKNYLFIVPFIFFIAGYLFMYVFYGIHIVRTPDLIGKYAHEALAIVARDNLILKLIDQKEDNDIPEGIILNQIPLGNTPIKSNQPIFVVVSKKSPAHRAPHGIGLSAENIAALCKKEDIVPAIYYVSHPYPNGICFAQYPPQGHIVEKNRIIFYISSGNNVPIIWPQFIGKNATEVTEFLHEYGMEPHIIYNTSNTVDAVVIDQRPLAGTILTLDAHKPISVYLRVQ